jgi:diacylglycerol kinase
MKSFFQSFGFAIKGIATALRTERNFKIQFAIGLLVITAGLYYNITSNEWYAVLITIALVLGLELMNSAMENMVNLVTKEHNPLAGKIKDFAAGAVLVVSIISAVIGILIFWKYIFNS